MTRIGSLGLQKDMEIMLATACFDPAEGHGWDPSGKLPWWTAGPMPSKPSCRVCRRYWKRRMEDRGLYEHEIKSLFAKLGASWDWGKKRETPLHRLSAETLLLIGEDPGLARKTKERAVAQKETRRLLRLVEPKIRFVSVAEENWTDWHEEKNREAEWKWDAVIASREAGNAPEMPMIVKYRVKDKD